MNKALDHKKTAIVLNDHLNVLGGGERSSLAYARALTDLGYDTRLLTSLAVPEKETIVTVFGPEFGDIPIEFIPWDGRADVLKKMNIDVFVNHSMMAFDPNPARLGLYLQMFPATLLNGQDRSKDVANLATYQHMICISSYTRHHTQLRWTYPADQQVIIAPPIGRRASEIAQRGTTVFPRRKTKTIVSIGRFNPRLQNKNQLILIRAFQEARVTTTDLEDWQLILIGNINPDPESEAYYKSCCEAIDADGTAIQIKSNIASKELFTILKTSFGYVHGAGAFVDATKEPERCEHYGIAVGEAMACGCIPLVYQYGGYWDFLEQDTGGIAYQDFDGLVEGFSRVAALYRTGMARTMRKQNRQAAIQLNQQHFTQQLAHLLGQGDAG